MTPPCAGAFCRRTVLPACVGIRCLLLFCQAAPVPVDYTSRRWQTEDGLPHNIVQAITQTRDGYLWIGTREGLARFDGAQFTPLEIGPGPRLPSITALSEAADGSLWIGTDASGLFRLHEGALVRFTKPDGLPADGIQALAAAPSGVLWVLSGGQILQYRNGQLCALADEQSKGGARSIGASRDGSVWVASGFNLKHITEEGTTIYSTANGLASNLTRSVLEARDGNLWIGYDGGLMRKSGETFTDYPQGAGPSKMVSVIHEDRNGLLWIGTYDGLYRFIDGSFAGKNRADDTPYEYHAICEDREGSIWVGGDDGLRRFTVKRFATYTQDQGLTYNKTACLSAGGDGSLWIGTWGGGLNRMKDGKVTAITHLDGLENDFIESIREARDGTLWIGLDYGGGLHRLKDGQMTHFGKTEGLMAATMTVIHEDESGRIWVGTRDGIYLIRDGRAVRYSVDDGLTSRQVNAICTRREGGFWIGTQKGLTQFHEGRFQAITASGKALEEPLIALYEDEAALWIGTEGSGLKRLKDGKLDTFTMKEGLGSNVIYSIQDDDRGSLWMSSNRGIFSVSKRELEKVAAGLLPMLTSVRYGVVDGIANETQTRMGPQPVACKTRDGRLWFRTMPGVVATDPNGIDQNPIPPPVLIEQILTDGRPLLPMIGAPAPHTPRNSKSDRSITVPPGKGELAFRYTALSFPAPERNRFKYQLEGVDLTWVDAGTQREAHYPSVPPGAYRFRVRASNNDGVWNDAGAEIAVILQPHFWQTWWFLGGAALLSVALIGLTFRAVTRRMMRRERERLEREQAVERERARIAQDIHDELGASLTEISMLAAIRPESIGNPAHLSARLGRIAETSNRVVESLDAIVWTVDPGNDSLASLGSYLASYTTDYLNSSGLICRLDIPAEIPPHEFSADLRHQLLMAVKEALHNAVRHGRASEVLLQLAVTNQELEISVRDNGCGFRPTASAAGNGLVNLKTRLSKLGGRTVIESTSGSGTSVRFVVPLPGVHSP